MIRGFIFHLIVLLFNVSCIYAQNLIPNPGFEEKDSIGINALHWRQPLDKFNHYSCKTTEINYPHTGSCYNAICMHGYKAELPNEYLSVRLKSTLQKGRRYNLKMYIRLDRSRQINPMVLDTLGWLFTEDITTVHGDFFVRPQVCFFISEKNLTRRYQWMIIEQTYIANGTEKYLTIGNFPVEKMVDDYRKEQLVQKQGDAPSNKKQKNKKRKSEDEKFREMINQKRQDNSQVVLGPGQHPLKYNIRYNFDDLSLELDSMYFLELPKIHDTITPQQFIPLNIYFETAKATLLNTSFQELDKMVEYLNKNSNYKVVIHGHTDNQGNAASNQKLSEERSKAVVDYFIDKNISITRLSYKGWGSSKPLDTNETPEGRERNRRVEMEVISVE